jgi:hypothetical protein
MDPFGGGDRRASDASDLMEQGRERGGGGDSVSSKSHGE